MDFTIGTLITTVVSGKLRREVDEEIKWRWLAQSTCKGVGGETDSGAKKCVADEDVLTALNRQFH